MSNINIQFDLSFDSDNRFATTLLQGDFTYIAEIDPPTDEHRPDSQLVLVRDLAMDFSNLNWLLGLSINDRAPREDNCSSIDYVNMLSSSSHKVMIFCLSGKEHEINDIKAAAAAIKSSGNRNIFAVTGNWSGGQPGKVQYVDSIDIIRSLVPMDNTFNIGAAVNPYRYNPEDVFLLYAKMKRKIASGCRYLVCQVGWDMMKAQELQWYLQMCDIPIPVFARVLFMRYEDSNLLNHRRIRPECVYPLPICEVLMRAAQQSPEKFLQRQIDLLALQTVGYYRLGFSGVQIAGCHNAAILQQYYDKVQEYSQECPDYDSWLNLWNREFKGYGMSEKANPFYLFNNLLQEGFRDPDFEHRPMLSSIIDLPCWKDRMESFLNKLAAEGQVAGHSADWPRKFLIKLTGVGEDKLAKLENVAYLDNSSCPRGLFLGQCGNANSNGQCDVTDEECFFHRVMKLASYNLKLDILEK